jgi:branched-chain amino acid transport system ATP-binding protein
MSEPETNGVAMLKVRNLRRSFAGVHAVDGLDFEVRRGSITGVIGPNGCGKTTSVNCITGFDPRYSGEVELEGRSIAHMGADSVARTGVMRTFQAIRVFDDYSVLQNALIGHQSFDGLAWWDPVIRTRKFRDTEEASRDKARSLLKAVGLGAKLDHSAGTLSYGQKKLLALATTLMSDPQLVILDEPVAGVNPTLTGEIAEVLRGLNRSGASFLIIEHNIQFIMELCDEVIVMDRGRRLTSGAPSIIQRDPRVIEAYLGGNAHAHG